MSDDRKAEYFKFLENLRRTGKTNMFGAAPYLAETYGLPIAKARAILSEWMRG